MARPRPDSWGCLLVAYGVCERHSGRPGSWKFASPVESVCAMTPLSNKRPIHQTRPGLLKHALILRGSPTSRPSQERPTGTVSPLCITADTTRAILPIIRPPRVRMYVESPPCRVPGSQGWSPRANRQGRRPRIRVALSTSHHPLWTCSSSVRSEPLPKVQENAHANPPTWHQSQPRAWMSCAYPVFPPVYRSTETGW